MNVEIEFLEWVHPRAGVTKVEVEGGKPLILKARIKQEQEQGEPVAWFRKENGENIYYATKAWDDCLPLYTTPQTKKWVGLTDEQIVDLVIKHAGFPTKLAEAIEAKLKEKNA